MSVHSVSPFLSVVVCVYNEAGNVAPLVDQISRAMQGVDYELIYVNDGSTDATLTELRAIALPQLIILDLQTNYGQSAALAAGIEAARGQFIATLDGDQQNDPADIPHLLAHCELHDLDVVAGLRANRQDGFWLRKVPSRIANALIRRATGLQLRDLGCGLKVFRADLAKQLGIYGELHRFVLLLAQFEGARMDQLPVHHRPRQIGQSKYGLDRTFRVISDLVFLVFWKKYRHKPMHLFGKVGVISLFMGLTTLSWLAVQSLIQSDPPTVLLPVGLLLTIGGLQFLGFGVIAELQIRTYYESQARKPYKVRRVYRASADAHRIETCIS
ncbi:glycosyltransferase [Spirosoma montaniterrae]|uniref:Family 2 glycosyl transferase n=1 Tax=Spirosoma montaniterrae TaxID=1178516 RepID=A0A1P9X174_9BACT|nr:glycosyltransferase [Spirosoma montaniterrae]AQG81386.1 family 2 glycosyl transferase [Spirosoma montaniterrae]